MDDVVSSICIVPNDQSSTSLSLIPFVAGSIICFLLWCWWMYRLVYIELMRTCCGHNAGNKLGGYNDDNLPDAEITTDSKDRDNSITIYVAKEIVTMDPSWPTAKVVACQYGRILGIGHSIEDLDPWLKRKELDPNGKDVVVDRTFERNVIVPGFIEQHGHPLIGGTALSLINVAYNETAQPYAPMIKGCKSKKEVLDRLRQEHKKTPVTDELRQKEPLHAWGYDSVAMGSHLTKEDLDQIDPDGKRCVFVWDCSMHYGYLNTPLMRELGLDIKNGRKYTMDGVGKDPKTGELTGGFFGVEAMQKYCATLITALMKPSRSLQSLHHITETARMGGITTTVELFMGAVNFGLELEIYKWFFDNELTPSRCVCVIDNKLKHSMHPFRLPLPNARADAAARWIRDQQRNSSEKLIFNNGVKFFADDSLQGLNIKLRFPGYVEPRRRMANWNTPPGATFVAEVLPFWKAGCRIHVHSNGDASQDALSEVIQTLQTIHPRFDHRFCIEHYGFSALHIHRKLKNLGVNVGVNVNYPRFRGRLNEAHVGKDRSHAMSRLKSMIDSGLVVAMHADAPVASPRPLEEIWFACNRLVEEPVAKDDDDDDDDPSESNQNPTQTTTKKTRMVSMCPAECVTPYQAMRMKTIDAAYVHGLDGIMGSIEAGKFADFTVLGENPLESDRLALKDIRVIATVIGGIKRMNVPQTRRVPAPPGDNLLGQLLWLKAMNTTAGTGGDNTVTLRQRMIRWMLLKLAAWKGSAGTLEETVLAQKERDAATTAATATAISSTERDTPRKTRAAPGVKRHSCALADDSYYAPIVCRNTKPKYDFNFRGCC